MLISINSISTPEIAIDSSLSFKPYLDYLNDCVVRKTLNQDFYQDIIQKFADKQHLLEPFTDPEILNGEAEIIKILENSIFPFTDDYTENIFAFSAPWYFKPFYFSNGFEKTFYNNFIKISDESTLKDFRREKTEGLYAHILKSLYNIHVACSEEAVYPVIDNETELTRYYKITFDLRFVKVHYKEALPELDKSFYEDCLYAIPDLSQLMKRLPLHNFSLEGFSIIHITDVTEDAAVSELKNVLIGMLSQTEIDNFLTIKSVLKNLIGIKEADVALIPFLKVNDKLVLYDALLNDCVIGYTSGKTGCSEESFHKIEAYFDKDKAPVFIQSFTEDVIKKFPFLKSLELNNISSYILLPVTGRNKLLGVLEIASVKENAFKRSLLSNLNRCYVLLVQALSNYHEHFNGRIEQLIKEKFTSLQPYVEWKFREVIFHYLTHHPNDKDAEIEKVIFENVYPFYGAVDIRNSSVERNRCLQNDLLEQLAILDSLLMEIKESVNLPLLDELLFKNAQLIRSVCDSVTTDEELQIAEFISKEIIPLFKHAELINPQLQLLISNYFSTTDQHKGYIYHHRNKLDASINKINNTLSNYLNNELAQLQSLYPNYYEKYKTDGVEYNIYIGKSISPQKPFSAIYLKNLYLWQLKTMAEMAKMTHQLYPQLPIPLQTTQLILVHSTPLSISFRRDERKFDVDDAYNMRYEIIKKRIDKIHVNETNERLTQPGKIAIIYSSAHEAELFEELINFLINTKLLLDFVERLDLEEMQGVSGLKALRVSINLDGEIESL